MVLVLYYRFLDRRAGARSRFIELSELYLLKSLTYESPLIDSRKLIYYSLGIHRDDISTYLLEITPHVIERLARAVQHPNTPR